ncbi:hypothetical protein CPC08DRAFT_343673 [Agrocybe pediades]|nr:hypothetical protein CPC08DRAFT_343673 [Agrocybe pediades]
MNRSASRTPSLSVQFSFFPSNGALAYFLSPSVLSGSMSFFRFLKFAQEIGILYQEPRLPYLTVDQSSTPVMP